MRNLIGIISCERFRLELPYSLIHFPYNKKTFPKTAVTFTLLVRNLKRIFLNCYFFVPTDFTPTFLLRKIFE